MARVGSSPDLGRAVRAARQARGLTQAQLAAQAGVGRQWLVAVERGHDGAEIGMVLRVLGALGLDLATVGSASRRAVDGSERPWLTAIDAAEAICEELARGDHDFALRLVARALADLRSLHDPDDIAMFLIEPPSTGDPRWDALLAATIGRQCRRLGIAAPAWTDPPPLAVWWFPVADPVLIARTIQRTPVDLAARGIWLDEKALEVR